MELQLRSRVVLITGASSGIGRATAMTLAEEGAFLGLGARDHDKLDQVAEDARALGGKVVAVAGDLTRPDAIGRLAAESRATFGGIHGLVCCVGSTPLGEFDEVTDDTWHWAFEMKFLATVRAIRAVLSTMRSQRDGRIVVVAGNIAQEPTSWMLTSGAVNAALGSLTSSLGRTYGAEGIGVNCVNPGPVRTARYAGMRAAVMLREQVDESEAEALIRGMIPDRHIAEPAEIAAQITYLLSPVARHVNGSTVVIDGAQTWAR